MNEEFNISQIIEILLPKWVFILVSTLLVAILSLLYSTYMIDPTYVAEGTVYITGDVNAISGSIRENTDLSDLMISQELAKTYGQILSSNTFFKSVAKDSGTGYTFRQIQSMARISNVEGTGLLKISIRNPDPEVAYLLANRVLNLAPEEISRVVVAGSATIIDLAELPKSPSSPNIPRNTMLGALAGLVLSILFVFLQNLFDKTIKTADEIKVCFGLPVLGTIPFIEPKKERDDTVI